MSEDAASARRVIGVEEHAWTPELRRALLKWGGDVMVIRMSSRGEVNLRLLEVGEERLSRMDAAGVDMEVLSITAPGTQPLPPQVAVPLAREANDILADAVRRHPDRFAAFATLPTCDPQAAAAELERAVAGLGHVGAMLFPRTGERFLDHASFRPVFEAAAQLGVPLYIHPAMPPEKLMDVAYSGFDEKTGLLLSTGGWGWHSEAGLAALRLILAGTLDRHPDLQIILGHWGEMLVPFADRADLLSTAATHLQRRVLDYITGNLAVTAGGIYSHRMLSAAADVLGPDRIMFGADSPFGSPTAGDGAENPGPGGGDSRGAFGGRGGARAFVDSAPLDERGRDKLGHLNAERILHLTRPATPEGQTPA
ncbi:amidohydrolase family protein [Amycolatopsis anabasis]|uniref:amidohydrolase family protein n=1 Tax=Amycolatopsis anabasis TaxID=1840409 RepID=UPI00131DFE33|nr:amidohydrolase family protein [Amycolatopsis anabasis]